MFAHKFLATSLKLTAKWIGNPPFTDDPDRDEGFKDHKVRQLDVHLVRLKKLIARATRSPERVRLPSLQQIFFVFLAAAINNLLVLERHIVILLDVALGVNLLE